MNDFKSEPQELQNEIANNIQRVIKSGWYVLGPELEKFEASWAKTCGLNHAIGVGNGMDAIEISLRACGIGPGDEVITTSMSAFATVLSIIRSGATPVLADINKDTAILNIESVERCISKKTKAVLIVHLFGQMKDMTNWVTFCNSNNLLLFEDCAQSHLATEGGLHGGSFGITGSYSFYPTKNLGAIGDAGAIVTNNSEIADFAKKLRNYGQSERYVHPEIGMNSRLDEIQASILQAKLKWLEIFTIRRQEIAKSYNKKIRNEKIRLLAPGNDKSHVYHLYVVNCDTRDDLQEYLLKNKISANLHYPVSMNSQNSLKNIRTDPEGLANSKDHAKTCISLPCHPQMLEDDVNYVIDIINNY